MKYVISIMLLLSSCTQVSESYWDMAEQLCAHHGGPEYVFTSPGTKTVRCMNGIRIDLP